MGLEGDLNYIKLILGLGIFSQRQVSDLESTQSASGSRTLGEHAFKQLLLLSRMVNFKQSLLAPGT